VNDVVRDAMRSKAGRAGIGAAAVLSMVLGCVLPGSLAVAAGMIGFLLLPLLLGSRLGPTRAEHAVVYGTGATREQTFFHVTRWLGVASFVAFACLSPTADGLAFGILGLWLGIGCALVAAMGLFAALTMPMVSVHTVTLEATTLTIKGQEGVKVVSYTELRTVDVEDKRIWLATGTDRHEVDVATADMANALGRLIAEAKAKADAEAQKDAGPMNELRRPYGMTAREWLGRIDAVAAANRSPGAYRGAAIDEDHLWQVLSDEQADVEARAAAARVLAASDDPAQRVRIDTSVKNIADEGTRIRVEVAMKPDTDEAAAEMEALEMEDLRKNAGV
jgi:hypothetical protein